MIYSRYSPNSLFNGENFISLTFYLVGFLIFVGCIGTYYYKYYKNNELNKLKKIDFGFILLFIYFFLAIISARGAVRVIMMLVPPASILIGYLAVSVYMNSKKFIEKRKNVFVLIIIGLILIATIFSGYSLYNVTYNTAKNYIPSSYTQQWQEAMEWVRENTAKDAVFGHWWDYGYWLQSIGNRATVLDGGNAISYWNHLMGRYALTGTNNTEALEFLYSHNTTHFLIDSTDIGKYGAFSSIGSDVNYDRRSWIPTMMRDDSRTVERKNITQFVYSGGTVLDKDIIYKGNGTEVFLPSGLAGLGAILVKSDKFTGKLLQPSGVYVYQNKQYTLPMRYAYFNNSFIDFGSGVESGMFFMPRIIQSNKGIQVEKNGALFYLSEKVVKSQLARLYLYGEEDRFKLVHTEDDFIIKSLKSQGLKIGDFAYYRGFRGPIKIWKIDYPRNIKFEKKFLNTTYPSEGLVYG